MALSSSNVDSDSEGDSDSNNSDSDSDSNSDSDSDSDGDSDADDCAKIEGSDIGRAGVTLEISGTVVTFDDWVGKAGSNGEYVGFTLSGGSVTYTVKAGTELFDGYEQTWAHPAGSGSAAHGVSNVVVCEDEGDDTPPPPPPPPPPDEPPPPPPDEPPPPPPPADPGPVTEPQYECVDETTGCTIWT